MRNEEEDNLIIHKKDEYHEQRKTIHADREELQQATRRFIRSLFRTGVNVALLPITRLPQEPRQHFLAAGREFTRGWATLVREFSDDLEEIAKDTSRPTRHGAGAHPPEQARQSQET